MRHIFTLFICLFSSMLLTGCVITTYGGKSPYGYNNNYTSPYSSRNFPQTYNSYNSPIIRSAPTPYYTQDSYSRIQESAISDGCRLRYSGNPSKLRRCYNGDPTLERKALEDGCIARYSGNPKKLRRCLND